MEVVQEALDALGLALVEHEHTWTPRERDLYEKASAFLARQSTAKLAIVVDGKTGRISAKR